MVSPAPLAGLYSKLRACCWTAAGAFITVSAWPNASEAPNPVMTWCRTAPLMTAVCPSPAPFWADAGETVAAVSVLAASRATAAAKGALV